MSITHTKFGEKAFVAIATQDPTLLSP